MKTNREFLETYLALPLAERRVVAAILPLDKKIIDARLSAAHARLNELALDRAEIDTQSGDSSRYLAHHANDRDKQTTDRDITKLSERLQAQVVDYPLEDEGRVTLGSKVTIRRGHTMSRLHIVGFSPLYSDIESASLDAPVTQAILGQGLGYTALLHLPKGPQELEILELDQTTLRLMDENNYGQTADVLT